MRVQKHSCVFQGSDHVFDHREDASSNSQMIVSTPIGYDLKRQSKWVRSLVHELIGTSMFCFVARMEDDVRVTLYDLLRPFPFSTPATAAYCSSEKHSSFQKYIATAPGTGFWLRTDSHVQKSSQEIRVGRNVNSPPCTPVMGSPVLETRSIR